ncbi:MAG: SpoIID/LytB domain-containing protein [Bacteroidales bacterium]|nr:SpoIID/LytB domain-containing protein [Bacteroidales bacterium]
MNKFLMTIVFWGMTLAMISQEISVAIFYDKKPQGVTITIQKGVYLVYNDYEIVDTLQIGNNINIIKEGDYLVYRNKAKAWATNKNVKIVNSGDNAAFFINYSGSIEPARCYEGWLKVKLHDYSILAINYVNIEAYVAAIVERLGTGMASEEFFKAQTVMYRTFCVLNYEKHKNEGFDLCDGIHCQVYNNKATNRIIINASKKTSNLVMVNKYQKLVNPVSHLNSGGYTAASEYVYGVPESHLKSIKDEFADNGSNYNWKILIPAAEWQTYLVKKGLKSAENKLYKQLLIIQQDKRLKEFVIDDENISLNTIRTDWGWQSSFFSMSLDKGVITVTGKGSGAGVGLSVESAKTMASKGFTYDKILNYYYSNIIITTLNHINIYSEMLKKTKKEKPL